VTVMLPQPANGVQRHRAPPRPHRSR